MKKKLLALLLAAALLLSLCPLALAEFYAEVYNTESLNIRSGPGSSYSWLGAVPLGERVRVVGTKSEFPAVSILGPVRKATQVELSLTDARSIGVTAPVRESGDIAGSGACKLVGPAGEVELTEGVIAAKRHIHATTADAERMGLENGQIVSVEIPSANGRNLTFGDVVVRVSDSYALAMHIDTDEANAAGMAPNTPGTIIK